jgi:hypothetical protein
MRNSLKTISGVSLMSIRHKEKKCYLVRIMEINDGTKYFIVKKNFKVKMALATPF